MGKKKPNALLGKLQTAVKIAKLMSYRKSGSEAQDRLQEYRTKYSSLLVSIEEKLARLPPTVV